MSALLKHPALWPHLALNPEPSMDPEDPRRWYLELYRDSLTPCQSVEPTKASIHAYIKSKCAVRPASGMHSLSRRR